MVYFVLVGKARAENTPLRSAFLSYLERVQRYSKASELWVRDETALLQWRVRKARSSWLVLLDSRGKLLSSAHFAAEWRNWQDSGKREIAVVVGPVDGWSDEARSNADFLLSFGPITLPHELAAVVAAEQVYRVHTILAGHPYHCGH